MFNSFLRFLGAEPEETSQVAFLLGLGFFIGLFVASFTVVGESLFVSQISDQDTNMPKAFIGQGLVGILLTYLFAFYQNRIDFARLTFYFLLGIAVTTTLILLGFEYLPDKKPLIFLIFVLMPPFGVSLLLIFWGTFNRLFTLRQAKRIIGSIDTGMLVAAIISFFSIPTLVTLLASTDQLLYFSVFSMFAALATFLLINRKFPLSVNYKSEQTSGGRSISKLGFGDFAKKKYLQFMVLFVTISMIAVKFLDFSFYSAADQYFISEDDLVWFLSLFNGTIVIFSFLFQTFITDKIISEYGLKVALLINPVLLTIFMAIALGAGSILGVGENSENIIIFFIVVAMSKLFISSLKDSLDGPSFKLYFLPIKSNIRLDIQSKVEGVFTVFATFISGGLILILSLTNAFGVLEVIIFMFPVLAFWYWVTTKMHNRYRITLKDTLEDTKTATITTFKSKQAIYQLLKNQVDEADTREVLYALELMERLEPVLFEEILNDLQKQDRDQSIAEFVQMKLKSLDIDIKETENVVTHAHEENVSEVRKLALEALSKSEQGEILSISTQRLNTLAKSRSPEMRLLTAKLLNKLVTDDNVFILIELLRDLDANVRIAAINTARKTQRPETWGLLIEHLNSAVYSHAAASALIDTGDRVLLTLEAAFHKSGQSDEIMRKIVQIYGRIGSYRAIQLLWEKIEYPDKAIVNQVLSAFKNWDIRATEDKQTTITNILDREIGCCLWNLAALTEIPKEDYLQPVRNAIHEEVDQNFDNIYSLLSFIYEPQSIQLVRDNIEVGTNEGIAFAIELLDVFLDPKLKPKLFPILDDIPVSEKIKQLEILYPRASYDEDEILVQIINRDYNYINRWTRACAIYVLSGKNEYQISQDVVAQLFNPDYLIRETAGWILYTKERAMFNKTALRLPYDIRKNLEDSLNYANKGSIYELQMRKVLFLTTLKEFEGISGVVLCELVEIIKEIELVEGQTLDLKDDLQSPIYILVQGQISIGKDYTFGKGDVFSEPMLRFNTNSNEIIAQADSLFFKFDKDKFFQIMIRHNELANGYIKHIKTILNPTQVPESQIDQEKKYEAGW